MWYCKRQSNTDIQTHRKKKQKCKTFLLSAGLNIDGIANRFSFCCFLLLRLRPKRALNVGIVGAADIGGVDIAAVADKEDLLIVFGVDIVVDEKALTEVQVVAITNKYISVVNDHVGRLLVLDIIVIVAIKVVLCWVCLPLKSRFIEDTAKQKIRLMFARHLSPHRNPLLPIRG